MRIGTGIAIIAAAAVLLVVDAFALRSRVGVGVRDILAALGGAAVGVGGLLLLHRDVSVASWVVAPAILALASLAHNRALFGGSGPLRT